MATQAFGLLLALTMVIVSDESAPSTQATAWAFVAGISGVIGLTGLFLALARGAMGLVAPLTAVIAATVPALVGILRGDPLDPLVALGMLLALGAVVAVAMPDRSPTLESASPRSASTVMADPATDASPPRGRLAEWALILMAGLGFAGFFLGVDLAHGAAAGPWWTLTIARVASLSVILVAVGVLVTRGRAPGTAGIRSVWMLVVASAIGDTSGNLFFVLSRAETTLAVSVVLSSLYPVSTAVLARVVLGERLSRLALVGVGLAIGGVVLIGYGSTAG